jgi:flavin reductase (DIM6/NTAB) family NADH-FMN oxidoreductase RutF
VDGALVLVHVRGMFHTIDPETLPPREVYQHMTSFITPRPIAWVSSVSPDGAMNLAPFSFFQGVCAKPPMLMFCPVNDREGRPKDTLRNVEATGEFVVNLVNFANAEAMNATAATLPYGESEFAKFGIEAAASERVKPLRVAAAPVALECVLHHIVRVSEGPLGGNIVIGRIVLMHIDESVRGADGLCDAAKLDTIGRLSGNDYVRTTERFTVVRPK